MTYHDEATNKIFHHNGVALPFHYDSCDDEDQECIWFFDCEFLEDFGKFRN